MSTEAGNDFPMLCETCLGPNPYIRMLKLPLGDQLCKISGLPYQSFRWKPSGGRQKQTVISYSVAKERNICQTCLNDMKYGLPVGVRDKLLNEMGVAHSSDAGARYHYAQLSATSAQHADDDPTQNFALMASQELNDQQLQVMKKARESMERRSSTSFRNLPKLCSFWMKGQCTRCVKGLCQFRPCAGKTTFVFPEIAGTDKELHSALVKRLEQEGAIAVMTSLDAATRKAIQGSIGGYNRDDAIRARVAGTDDYTKKILDKTEDLSKKGKSGGRFPQAPEDHRITTLWLSNIDPSLTQTDVHNGIIFAGSDIKGMHIAKNAKCAFVEYGSRQAAEDAVMALWGKAEINGEYIGVNWAKPKTGKNAGAKKRVREGADSLQASAGTQAQAPPPPPAKKVAASKE